jgi:multidrug efflux pump subunit AcrA (membrane-fusion protein)
MTDMTKDPDELMAKVLGTDPSAGRRRRRVRLLVTAAAIAVIALAVLVLSYLRRQGSKVEYITTEVARGNLTVTISATGNLAPMNQVDVGSEVSGLIVSVFVDDNDKVTKGQVLAQIDLSKLNDEVAKSKANLTSAEAKLAQTQATVAESRAQMKLEVDIDEADVGDVREGQDATFTVDAYPNRTYHATVERVRLGSTTTSGIVSYEAVLTFTNDDLSLRPGMTGNASITTLNRENVILVPAAAFRWSPPAAQGRAPSPDSKRGLVNSLIPHPPDREEKKTAGFFTSANQQQTLWVLREGKPDPMVVTVGASNGRVTEVTSGNLEPGTKVITETAIPVQ